MRNKLLIVAALFATTTAPAFALSQPQLEAAVVKHSVGQPVYDLNDFRIGTIEGYGVSGGTPAALVRLNGDGRVVAIAFGDIGRGDRDGWRTALSQASINGLRDWYPGTIDPAG